MIRRIICVVADLIDIFDLSMFRIFIGILSYRLMDIFWLSNKTDLYSITPQITPLDYNSSTRYKDILFVEIVYLEK